MKPSQFDDRFHRFPYRPESREDDVNNGGFDLVQHPELISSIHEIATFPALRKLIVMMNSPEQPTMTLGCAHGKDGDVVLGYLDFSFRSLEIAQNESFIAEIDGQFMRWIDRIFPGRTGLVESFRQALFWDYQPFRYYETEPRLMISMTYRAGTQDDAGHLIDWVHRFFLEGLTLPIR